MCCGSARRMVAIPVAFPMCRNKFAKPRYNTVNLITTNQYDLLYDRHRRVSLKDIPTAGIVVTRRFPRNTVRHQQRSTAANYRFDPSKASTEWRILIFSTIPKFVSDDVLLFYRAVDWTSLSLAGSLVKLSPSFQRLDVSKPHRPTRKKVIKYVLCVEPRTRPLLLRCYLVNLIDSFFPPRESKFRCIGILGQVSHHRSFDIESSQSKHRITNIFVWHQQTNQIAIIISASTIMCVSDKNNCEKQRNKVHYLAKSTQYALLLTLLWELFDDVVVVVDVAKHRKNDALVAQRIIEWPSLFCRTGS